MLALLAASIVSAHDQRWLARPVADLCRDLDVRPEVPCRLKARLLESLEALLARATRRGRPSARPADPTSARLEATEALLAVAAGILKNLRVRSRALQDRLVAAQARLAAEQAITRRTFCQSLGLAERTFRSWAARPPKPTPLVASDPPARPRPVRRGRFALDVVPAGIQAMADTTAWELFGVPLKVVALQDPGARDVRLWEGFEVGTREDAETVVRVVTQALENRPGTQLITDQGTPYLAAEARRAYENLELDHAPQKEADPTAKSTLERSFGVVKQALEPLARLSHKLAEKVPALRSEPLASSLGKLLLSAFLAVYFSARSPREARVPDPQAFAALAERNRDQARAEDRSRRLALERIHAQYQMPGSKTRFVDAFRGYRVEDILEGERRMGAYACRCHARACDRYFAAIVRRVVTERAGPRAKARDDALREAAQQELARRFVEERTRLLNNPADQVVHALRRMATYWLPDKGSFLFGEDPPAGELRQGLTALASTDPLSYRDRTEVAWRTWRSQYPDLAPVLEVALRRVFDHAVQSVSSAAPPLTSELARGMLNERINLSNRRPPPRPNLRI